MILPNQGTYSDYWIFEGILFFVYHEIPFLDLKIAKRVLKERLEFQDGRSFPILCETKGIQDASKSARDFLALEGSILANAVAIVEQRIVAQSMIQLYLRRNQPLIPTEVFNNSLEAQKFLYHFLNSSL
ncbi:MAG TPA: hypothetical protein DHV22_04705 [Xanthomarina gelatinilytica]|uniref:DUF7793 domain-containing protein n=1 Tax=Xanthomarina gelatinilytica TaxID=1137281 RepID=A0A3D6BNX8_9FLAO|nr:hypothetical protein [Xanthomarina gelatinilytica]